MKDSNQERPGLALKIGIAGAIGLGAVVSGLLISRRGRRLVREAWEGRRRTRIEDRVLDALWGDDVVGRRNFDVKEAEGGVIVLSGVVRSRRELMRALRIAEKVKDVQGVEDRLVIERMPRPERNRLRPLARAARRRFRHATDEEGDE